MKQVDQLVRKFDFTEAVVGIRKDGIVHVYYKPGTEITVTLQKKMLVIFNEITEGIKHPFIFEAAEYCTVTKEARDNAIVMEDQTPIRITAVYVTNLAHRIIAEFYYKFNRPKQPYKVVSDFNDGIEWLLKMKSESLTA